MFIQTRGGMMVNFSRWDGIATYTETSIYGLNDGDLAVFRHTKNGREWLRIALKEDSIPAMEKIQNGIQREVKIIRL